MLLPSLYKYLNVDGAKKTLDNRTFRFAKPSSFNDLEDMTASGLFPGDLETALKNLSENFVDVICKHKYDAPTCSSKMAGTLIWAQALFKLRPSLAAIIATDIKTGALGDAFDLSAMLALAERFVKETNDLLQDYRVFCVTTDKYSNKMWKMYAEEDKGIALRIVPNTEKASKFEVFRPVVYKERRPAIFDSTADFLEQIWFGDQARLAKDTLAKIIFTKTLEWKDECEYRLAIPLDENEEPYDTLNYHPEEITELYLGAAITKENRDNFVSKARSHNRSIEVFAATRDLNGKISFSPI